MPAICGYGGRCDLFGYLPSKKKWCVIDFKTQNVDGKKKFNFYPSWGPQLAAYWNAIAIDRKMALSDCILVAIAISSADHTRIEIKEYEYKPNIALFTAASLLWSSMHDYFPLVKEPEESKIIRI